LIKKFLFVLIVCLLLSPCSDIQSEPKSEFADLLPSAGHNTIVVVIKGDTGGGAPEITRGLNREEFTTIERVTITKAESFQRKYPTFNLKTLPSFLFFDSNGLIFQTSDPQEAKNYLFQLKVND